MNILYYLILGIVWSLFYHYIIPEARRPELIFVGLIWPILAIGMFLILMKGYTKGSKNK